MRDFLLKGIFILNIYLKCTCFSGCAKHSVLHRFFLFPRMKSVGHFSKNLNQKMYLFLNCRKYKFCAAKFDHTAPNNKVGASFHL